MSLYPPSPIPGRSTICTAFSPLFVSRAYWMVSHLERKISSPFSNPWSWLGLKNSFSIPLPSDSTWSKYYNTCCLYLASDTFTLGFAIELGFNKLVVLVNNNMVVDVAYQSNTPQSRVSQFKKICSFCWDRFSTLEILLLYFKKIFREGTCHVSFVGVSFLLVENTIEKGLRRLLYHIWA